MNEDDEVATHGWDAITTALSQRYGDQKPAHWGTFLRFRIGGPDPLDGISAYRHEDASGAHWHYISFGLTELYAKEFEEKSVSGWGFEFTFRLKCGPDESTAPQWPLGLLQNLARYVFQSGNVFAVGHHLPLNGPILQGSTTEIQAAIFAEDNELKTIDSPNGRLQFLQLVGVTLDELAAARSWDSTKLLDVMRQRNPLLVTDLARGSLMKDPVIAGAVNEGSLRDGSSCASSFMPHLVISKSADALRIEMGAGEVPELVSMLRGRTCFGRPFMLAGPESAVQFTFGPQTSASLPAANTANLQLNVQAGVALASLLRPIRGTYESPLIPGVVFTVVPSEIKSYDGKTIVSVIG